MSIALNLYSLLAHFAPPVEPAAPPFARAYSDPKLPQDVLDMVCTDDCISQADLLSLSLVSRGWLSSAQRALWTNLTVKGDDQACCLLESPLLSSYRSPCVKLIQVDEALLSLLGENLTGVKELSLDSCRGRPSLIEKALKYFHKHALQRLTEKRLETDYGSASRMIYTTWDLGHPQVQPSCLERLCEMIETTAYFPGSSPAALAELQILSYDSGAATLEVSSRENESWASLLLEIILLNPTSRGTSTIAANTTFLVNDSTDWTAAVAALPSFTTSISLRFLDGPGLSKAPTILNRLISSLHDRYENRTLHRSGFVLHMERDELLEGWQSKTTLKEMRRLAVNLPQGSSYRIAF